MRVHLKSVVYEIKEFLSTHKKTVVCFSLLFVAGVIIGIISAVNSVGGVFEKLSKNDMTFGSVKVFFFSSLFIFAGYVVLTISSCVKGMSFLSILPFAVLGYMMGSYICVLVGVYGGIGVMNLIFIYIPFYLVTFFSMLVGGSVALFHAGNCACKDSLLKPSVVILIKTFGINILSNGVIILLIGAVTKVIVVSI